MCENPLAIRDDMSNSPECKSTGRLQGRYRCIRGFRACRAWMCWIHLQTGTRSVSRVSVAIDYSCQYLQLTSPYVGRWIVHQATSEVALYPTDQVVVLGVRSFPTNLCQSAEIRRRCGVRRFTHEMIPKAWYSMMEEREIRASRPCCIPRSNLRIATLGEGYVIVRSCTTALMAAKCAPLRCQLLLLER